MIYYNFKELSKPIGFKLIGINQAAGKVFMDSPELGIVVFGETIDICMKNVSFAINAIKFIDYESLDDNYKKIKYRITKLLKNQE